MVNKIYKETGILIITVVLACSYVSAFGLGSAYHVGHPLELYPGETREIIFNLQNMGGSEDITASGSIGEGSEIMNFVDSSTLYSVPIGASVDVKARVSMPSNANVGDVYSVRVSFTTVTESDAGTFTLGSGVARSFSVVVVPKPAPPAPVIEELPEEKPVSPWTTYLIVILVLLAVILVIWIVVKKKK